MVRAFGFVVCLAAVFSGAGPAWAQAPQMRTLAGVVVRSDTHAPVNGAAVVSQGQAVITEADGRFQLTLPAGKATVEVSASGFFHLATEIDLTAGDVTAAEFLLAPNAAFNAAVEVVATAPTVSPAATPVTPADVLKTPGALDNVFRALQLLPGVAPAQEFSSRLTVRGGAPDQNLTVMDGVEIHDPYRLFGLTSAFNPEIIRRFELATGGFSAKYGDRLSSLLVVENRDGDASRRLGGSATMSITDANVVFEGFLPGVRNGSWLVTGRRTYYDLVAERLTDQQFPGFADLQTKLTWEPQSGHRLSAFGLRSRQSAALNIDEEDATGEFNDNTANDVAWLRYDRTIGRRGHAATIAGYSNSVSDFGVNGAFQTTAQRSNAPDDAVGFGVASVVFTRRLTVRDWSLRQELAWTAGPHTIEAGGEWHGLTSGLRFLINGDRNPMAANGSSVQGGAGLPDRLDSTARTSRGGAWLTGTWRAGARGVIDSGIRIDRASFTRETTVSPRLSATIALSPATSLTAALGHYTQSPGYEKAISGDYVLDVTAAPAGSLKSERAWLASMTIQRTFANGLQLKAEGYGKWLDRVLVGRLETAAERAARAATYDFPASLAWSVPVEPLITTTPENSGRGRAYGVDLLVSRMSAPASARLRGWMSYTWGRATRDAYGRTYAFEYDRRHAVSSVLSYRLSPKWEVASTVRWATGFPRTAPVGLIVAGAADVLDVDRDGNRAELVPKRDAAGRLVYQINLGGVGNLNGARLPDFARTDVRATWRPKGPTGRWEFYLEVINLFDRQNAGVLDPRLAFNPASDRPAIVEQPDQGVPRLPTLGLRWRF